MERRTRLAVENAARAEGAVRVEWEHNAHNSKATLVMPDGTRTTMRVGLGGQKDPLLYRNWVRQHIRRALRS